MRLLLRCDPKPSPQGRTPRRKCRKGLNEAPRGQTLRASSWVSLTPSPPKGFLISACLMRTRAQRGWEFAWGHTGFESTCAAIARGPVGATESGCLVPPGCGGLTFLALLLGLLSDPGNGRVQKWAPTVIPAAGWHFLSTGSGSVSTVINTLRGLSHIQFLTHPWRQRPLLSPGCRRVVEAQRE